MCTSPYILSTQSQHTDGLTAPCRNCRECRIQRSSQWALRISHEYHSFKNKGIFLTLTYDDNHLPHTKSISKRELQQFIKRLRYYMSQRPEYKNTKIKYYGCGEYGETKGRPHYHIIILGMDLSHMKIRKHPKSGFWVEDSILNDAWTKGYLHAGTVTPESIQYVTHYIDKKYIGHLADKNYHNLNLEPPFQICSLGMGLSFATTIKKDLEINHFIMFRNKKVPVPQYYRQKLGLPPEPYRELAKQSQIKKIQAYMQKHNQKMEPSQFIRHSKLINYTYNRDIRQQAYKKLSSEEISEIYHLFNTINQSHSESLFQKQTNINKIYQKNFAKNLDF